MVTCTRWWSVKPLRTTQDVTPAWPPTVSEQTTRLLRFTSKVRCLLRLVYRYNVLVSSKRQRKYCFRTMSAELSSRCLWIRYVLLCRIRNVVTIVASLSDLFFIINVPTVEGMTCLSYKWTPPLLCLSHRRSVIIRLGRRGSCVKIQIGNHASVRVFQRDLFWPNESWTLELSLSPAAPSQVCCFLTGPSKGP